ncbi:MAG: DNA topoisomerase (ATP-hydrolyzing), partial [Anaerolineaceae bacterium]|nr:DNA topoisomerase (ATP-hydrolyzing) [Anaerolineaceae bacterium]
RILYSMYDMGLRLDSPYKKSARIVGEVLGKYHPHGDMAVYEAMARLAQDFTIRYPLVDGQGNFGSVDGDPPAAMRYTEARLTAFAMELLSQIDRNTVDFGRNFDDTLSEPEVLPSAVPNMLVNGASGIAVGMATNIPPHNLGEVIDSLVYLLHNWDKMDDISVPDIMQILKGPDFPTGGIILQEGEQNEILSAYATGRGKLLVRGRVHAEEISRGRTRLIVSELPYLVNKTTFIERIAELVREGSLEGIADLRDESDRQGMRVVIELNKAAEMDKVLRALYQRTPLQTTFGINMLALVNGEPRLLSIKQALKVYLEHRLEVVRRRSEHDLEKARQRAHILEGLRIAIKFLDEIITLIRNAPDVEKARERLIRRFKLTEVQANAILDMPLRRLAALERKKIEEEYKELQRLIKELENLLRSPKKMRELVENELLEVKDRYNDGRRTHIVALKNGESARMLLTSHDLTPSKNTWVGIMPDGTIARVTSDSMPKISGKLAPRWLIQSNTRHTLYVVAENGQAAAVAVESLPEAEHFENGGPVSRLTPLHDLDFIAGIFSLPPKSDQTEELMAITVSRQGQVKKSSIADLPGPSGQGFVFTKVNSEDALLSVFLTGGDAPVFLVTAGGMGIRFSEQEVRPMGLVAAGVGGIKLKPGDYVVGGRPVLDADELLLVSDQGQSWRMAAAEFPLQSRFGTGLIACKLPRGAKLVGCLSGKGKGGTLFFEKQAPRLIHVSDVAPGKRLGAAQTLAALKTGDMLLEVAAIPDQGKGRKSSTAGSGETREGDEKAARPRARRAAPAVAAPKAKEAGAAAGTASTPDKPAAKRKPAAPASTTKTRSTTSAAQPPSTAGKPAAGKSKAPSVPPAQPAEKATGTKKASPGKTTGKTDEDSPTASGSPRRSRKSGA